MTAEARKHPNYEASAMNLVNPPIIGLGLNRLHFLRDELNKILVDIEKSIPPELIAQRSRCETLIEELMEALKTDIVKEGSYQNTETGEYALRQKRESITYKPDLVRQFAPPDIAYRVIVESVDQVTMRTMINEGEISLEQARQCGEVRESYAFIIK